MSARMRKKGSTLANAIIEEVAHAGAEAADSDDDLDATKAKVIDASDEDDHAGLWSLDFEADPRAQGKSALRLKNAKFLSDLDPRYAGKKSSRQLLSASRDETEHETAEFSHMFDASSSEGNRSEDGEDDDEEEGDNEYDNDSDEEAADQGQEPDLLTNDSSLAEVQKGLAIKQQLKQWDSLFESRIQLQKMLYSINQFPQPGVWAEFMSRGSADEGYIKSVKKCQTSLADLLDSLLQLRAKLLESSHSELRGSLLKNGESEDEELLRPAAKRMKLKDYSQLLQQIAQAQTPFRNETVEKWNDKTRLAIGHIKAKDFSNFESSTLQQIELILADKARLVKRTQLKRSSYQVLGSAPPDPDANMNRDYDEEVFDDDDFYHQLLRELIERKTQNLMSDSSDTSHQWLQIQKMRSKIKKKVDTKASKGRKTRFDIHAKLVNFMAPRYTQSMFTHDARTELFKSLFAH